MGDSPFSKKKEFPVTIPGRELKPKMSLAPIFSQESYSQQNAKMKLMST